MKVHDDTIRAETVRKIQKSQYYILKAFKQFCDDYDLTYTLDFGTMIGAVRHQGFVPWDDDIDVAMLRDDYERFLVLTKRWGNPNIFVQNYHTDPEFIHSFTRLRLNGTLAIQEDWQYLNVHHGIFIDIFPYDTVAGNKEACQKHADEIREIQEEKMSYVLSRSATPEVMRRLNQKQTACVGKYNRGFKDNDVVSHMTQGLDSYYDYRRSVRDFKDCVDVLFEHDLFPIPKRFDRILKNTYNDYLSFPLPANRKPHHGVIQLKFRPEIVNLFDGKKQKSTLASTQKVHVKKEEL